MNRRILLVYIIISIALVSYSQEFQSNQNSSYIGGGCYELMPDSINMFGSIWNYKKVDISKPFDKSFTMNFGTRDTWGGDGACFVMQNDPNGLNTTGTAGGWLGAGAITPMIGVEFDIYENTSIWNDTGLGDHVGIFKNGDNVHGSSDELAPPVGVSNIEDGLDHNIRIKWDPATLSFEVYMDCSLLISINYNIIDSIFSGDTLVYWGFTASSGWYTNRIVTCGLQTLPDTLQICYGDSIQIDASFYGSPGYLWTPSSNINNPTSSTPIVYPANSQYYSVSFFDACGIVHADSVFIEVFQLPVVDLGPDTAICDGDSLMLDAGTSGNVYSWNPNGETSQVIYVSATDNYFVTVTDTNTCSNTDNINVVVNPLPPASINGNLEICYNDSTLLNGTGGDEYLWSTGSTDTSIYVAPVNDSIFFVTVTDTITGCVNIATDTVVVNSLPVPLITGDFSICLHDTATLIASGGDEYLWNTGQTNDTIYVSPTDTSYYTVLVTDTITGCRDSLTDTLNIKPLPIVQITGDTAICFGDSLLLVASATDLYLWSTADNLDSIYVNPVADSTFILMGTDTVTTCSDYDTITVVVHDIPAITITPDTAICTGNSVDLNASGGVGYHWGPNLALTDVNISNPTATPEFTITYTVTVTSSFGCVDSADVTVTVNELPTFFLDGDSVTCNGYSDGSAWISYVGSSGPYSYEWGSGATDTVLTGLSGGTYTVTVTNIYGCTTVKSIYIHEPAALSDSIVISDLLCYNDSTGAINVIVSGGTQPYLYEWDNGMTNSFISGLSAGAYSVTVTDDNSCKLTIVEINVYQPDSLIALASSSDVSCNNLQDGTASSLVTGGTTPYSYLWSNGDTIANIQNIGSNFYYLTVTDDNNCYAYDTTFVDQPPELVIIDSVAVNPGCYESSDGIIYPLIQGGTKPYQFLWSNYEVSDSIVNLYGGEYSLTVTDGNNCEATYSWLLTNPSATCLLIPNLFTPNGDSYNDKWQIKGIEYYPEALIEVYNRWGDVVFSSSDYYSNPWDGTINGNPLPVGSYVYIIDMKDGSDPVNGIVSIKR